MNKPRRRVLQR